MDAFIISSLPSPMLETLQMAGPLRSADITPLHRYYGPSRHPLVFGRLPGFAGYTAYLLRRFRAGTRRASPVALHVLVTVLSLPPRRGEHPYRSVFGCSCGLRPPVEGSALGDTHFRGHNAFTVCYGPVTRGLPWGDLVDRLQSFSFHRLRYPNYGALTSTPAGLSPAEHASLRWTHNRTCRSPASGSPTGFTARYTESTRTARGFGTV